MPFMFFGSTAQNLRELKEIDPQTNQIRFVSKICESMADGYTSRESKGTMTSTVNQ
jgi:hypothetical protein